MSEFKIEDYLEIADEIALRFLNIPGAGVNDLVSEAQDALRRAMEVFPGNDEDEFRKYAKRAIYNRLRDHYRKIIKYNEKIKPLSGMDGNADVADDNPNIDVFRIIRRKERQDILAALIKELPAEDQVVLTGVMSDRKYSEIGEEMGGITKQAVSKKVNRAYRHLREEMEKQGWMPTASGYITSKKT